MILNTAILLGDGAGVTSKVGLSRVADRTLADEHPGRSGFILNAMSDAIGLLHNYRKAKRKRWKRSSVGRSIVRRLLLKANDSQFHLDAANGHLRLSVGPGTWIGLDLPMCAHHRGVLTAPGARMVQLTVTPTRVCVAVETPAPEPYRPEAVLALDTNESSLDGVILDGTPRATAVRVPFPDVRTIQGRHFVRRRNLARKKAGDRRERNRVKQRLHLVSKGLVQEAKRRRAAIVLENLTGIRRFFSPTLNRRLSSWPHRQLHQQTADNAVVEGVPIIWVSPRGTSKTCPACGWRRPASKTRTRAGAAAVFACGACGWRCDRQLNAGANIGKTALDASPELGALRFTLDGVLDDAMILRYEPPGGAARGERMGTKNPHRREMGRTSRHGKVLASSH